ncbi:hypothetical protein SELMODRAFT_414732 [Selaginella moellendorffii]|uniref:Uncharacterized protein n=1 Tax=Selaginella moellendorffii TaxID=88036 RepID=D8RTR9_SELML|nr:hypothetical protein SELMODRAFT_414732 [Selaginella moellendorffii]
MVTRGERFYSQPGCFGPQVHHDGIVFARVDKPEASSSFNGEPIHFIVSEGHRGTRHSWAPDLALYRLEMFNNYYEKTLTSGITVAQGIETLFSSWVFKQELIQVEEEEKRLKEERKIEGDSDSDDEDESIGTIQDNEWLPELHSNVIVLKGSHIAVSGPAFLVALVGGSHFRRLTSQKLEVVEAEIQPEDLLLVSSLSLEELGVPKIKQIVMRERDNNIVSAAAALLAADPDEESTVLVADMKGVYHEKIIRSKPPTKGKANQANALEKQAIRVLGKEPVPPSWNIKVAR